MKRILISLLILSAACSQAPSAPLPPAATVAEQVNTSQPIVQTATLQISPTLTPPVAATATPRPKKAQLQDPGNANKSKEKKPAVAPMATNPDFMATPILGRPTDTTVTVNVVPAYAMDISYEIGTAPGEYSRQTSVQPAAAGVPLETVIDNLQPNTRYTLRLRYGDKVGPELTFVTQRAPGSTFTFNVQGDSHPERAGKQFDAGLYARTLAGAAAENPDFYFTTGDDFSVDTLKSVSPETVRALYINQRQYLGLVGAPVFLVNGNHEQASLVNLDGTPDNVAVWAQTARNDYFPQPAPDSFYSGNQEPVEHIGLLRDYFAFTWGDALFVVIDPYWHSPQPVDNVVGAGHSQKPKRDLWSVTLGETQYRWLQQTLQNSDAKYKFVFAHHVNGTGRGGIELADTYEWGDSAGLVIHRPGWEATIHQLFVENGVTIFFQGHDHLFARQELDGVIYQTLPEPANPNATIENQAAYQSGDLYPNSGHVRVTVSPEGVEVSYVRSFLDRPEEVAFSYTILNQ